MRSSFLRLVLLVARRDYLRTVRRRGFIAGTLLLPAAMATMFAVSGFLSTMGAEGQTLGPLFVVNQSAVTLSADPALTPHVVLVSQAEADAHVADGTVSDYYVVPGQWPAQPDIRHVVAAERGPSRPLDALTLEQTSQAEIEILLRVSILRDAGLPDTALAR